LRKAVELDPQNGAFLDSLGWVRHKRNDDKEAATLLEQSVKATPDPLIYDHLGDVYMALHQPERALEVWNKALALSPKNEVIQKKAADAASHVTPGSDQRKYLKYFEGNMRQVSNLGAQVTVQARYQKHPVKALGKLIYVRPDHVTFVLLPSVHASTPMAEVEIQNEHIQINPPVMAKGLNTLSLQSLATLPKFFSGTLLQMLDSPDVKTVIDSTTVHYVSATQEAWINTANGALTHFVGPDAQGGRDEIDASAYTQVDGIWLPMDMHLRNRVQGWNARVHFSEWVVNSGSNRVPPLPQ
jgi:tetratricopeptide (TPR) repeat protein